MASDSSRFNSNDKKRILLEPSGEAGQEIFRARLTDEEKQALAALKEAAPEHCSKFPDSFLMRFIWARKFDVARAVELLNNHMQWREEYNIDNLDMDAVRNHFTNGMSIWAPGHYCKQGYSVSYLLPRNISKAAMKNATMKGMLHASYFSLDLLSDHDMDIARKGTIIVEDFEGASFSDLMGMARGDGNLDMNKMMEQVQNHLPMRMGAIIIVNAPWYLRLLLAISKPMMKPKLRKKIHVVTTAELDQFFTPEQLPTFFGGTFEVDSNWCNDVLATRTSVSDGRYVDPSPRSEQLVNQYTGPDPVQAFKEVVVKKKK